MSTAESKINKILIYPNKKLINIIVRDINGNNKYSESILYDDYEKELVNLDDVGTYITEKFNSNISPCCCYDFKTKCKILYAKAKENKDFLDWKTDFFRISIREAFHYLHNNPITIIIIDSEYGIGNATGSSLLDKIQILQIIISIIKKIYVFIKIAINPFKELNKEYHVGENMIKETILLGDKWQIGFISSEEIKNKKLIEKSIMRKLGYKKQENNWIKAKEEKFNIYDMNKLYY